MATTPYGNNLVNRYPTLVPSTIYGAPPDWNMGSWKIINLGDANIDSLNDAVNVNVMKKYMANVQGVMLTSGSKSMTGDLNMGGNSVINVKDINLSNLSTGDLSAVTTLQTVFDTISLYGESSFVQRSGDTMSGTLNMEGNSVISIADVSNYSTPTASDLVQAANLGTVINTASSMIAAIPASFEVKSINPRTNDLDVVNQPPINWYALPRGLIMNTKGIMGTPIELTLLTVPVYASRNYRIRINCEAINYAGIITISYAEILFGEYNNVFSDDSYTLQVDAGLATTRSQRFIEAIVTTTNDEYITGSVLVEEVGSPGIINVSVTVEDLGLSL